MGRRPNPLLVEFFERGAKLEDSSNRYQHTCRKCGELFPKGRADTLTSHLLRKCPDVSQEDREWIANQLQQSPEKASNQGLRPQGLQSVSDHQHQSALDTLAEVSRHHLDYSLYRSPSTQGVEETFAEQALIAQLRQANQSIEANPSTTENDLYPPNSISATSISPLVQTASAANQQLEAAQHDHTQESQGDSLLDPQLHDMSGSVSVQSMGHAQRGPIARDWNPKFLQPGPVPYTTIAKPLQGLPMIQASSPTKKVRGHFEDARRKEVQEIRKRGACIRCRMLKKPCSGETPCSTCSSVESARVWRGKCLRTKIADEFNIWSARLFYSRASIEVSSAVHGLECQSLEGRIVVRLFPKTDACLYIAARLYRSTAIDRPDGTLRDRPDRNLDGDDDVLVLDDSNDITDQLQQYIEAIVDAIAGDEPELFMRATLHEAQTLAKAEELEPKITSPNGSAQQSVRSCYNLQDRLVRNTIELWVLTRVLVSQGKDNLQLQYTEPRPQASSALLGQTQATATKTDIPRSSPSCRLIQAQLLAIIESRCVRLGKIVISELERRLLKRQHAHRYATFISTVLLLNCMERMTWLYRSFDTAESANGAAKEQQVPNGDGHDRSRSRQLNGAANQHVATSLADHSSSWPLDTPPSVLWQQGPCFADLLSSLLHMRALPPRTGRTSDGHLVVIAEQQVPSHATKPAREPVDDQSKAAAAWLDPMRLSVSELQAKRDGQAPAQNCDPAEWDMRFIAKVLLPERL